MAVESFPELLQKLRDVHEHELEVWQERVLELTNKKNIDSNRLEELHNRNQQLREQQRILTENIKQLENRLRAGLCDRCTVTQEMAKKRQQNFETSQIQSLQHISLLVTEMNVLRKENDRLREELKTSREPQIHQNGHSEEMASPEVKASPKLAVTPGLKISQSPAGDANVNLEIDGSVTPSLDKAPDTKLVHSRGKTFSFEPDKLVIPNSSQMRWATEHVTERRAASLDSLEHGHSPLSPSLPSPLLKNNPVFSSATSEERTNRQQIHAPVPFRPLPIKTGPLSIPWPLSESSEWVSVAVSNSGGLSVSPNLSAIPNSTNQRFPKLISLNSLQSRLNPPLLSSQRAWCRRNPSEIVESREKRATEAVTVPPQWNFSASCSERIFGENLRDEEEETPLDLSDSGRPKDQENEQTQLQSDASSSSSSSPPATLSSSSRCASSPQSDQQTPDNNAQEGTQERSKEQDEVKDENEKSAAESSVISEYKKVPTLTISLQPVVVMESLKTKEQVAEPGSRSVEQEEKENNNSNKEASRKRASQGPEASPQRSVKERRIRLSRFHVDADQR